MCEHIRLISDWNYYVFLVSIYVHIRTRWTSSAAYNIQCKPLNDYSRSNYDCAFIRLYCRPHWKSSAPWPPEDAAGQPLVLHLTAPPPRAAVAGSPRSTPAPGARDATDPTTAGHSRPHIGRGARDVHACKDGRLEAEPAAIAASASMAVDTSRFLKVPQHRASPHRTPSELGVSLCTLSECTVRPPGHDADSASDPLKHMSFRM